MFIRAGSLPVPIYATCIWMQYIIRRLKFDAMDQKHDQNTLLANILTELYEKFTKNSWYCWFMSICECQHLGNWHLTQFKSSYKIYRQRDAGHMICHRIYKIGLVPSIATGGHKHLQFLHSFNQIMTFSGHLWDWECKKYSRTKSVTRLWFSETFFVICHSTFLWTQTYQKTC